MRILQTSALLVMLLCACRNDARLQWRQHLAALKVAAEQSQTQAEFHQRWTECAAFMTTHPLHRLHGFQPLEAMAKATDTVWRHAEESRYDRVYCGEYKSDTPCWPQLLVISPSMTTNMDRFVTIKDSDRDAEFWLSTHVQRGRAKVAQQCDELLQKLH